MNDDKHKAVQELLKEIFKNVNDWLIFMEAKNAALIAFNVACMAVICNVTLSSEGKIVFYIVCIGIIISTIMALISFMSKTNKNILNKGNPYESDNLIFYKDIAKYDKKEYIKKIFKQYEKINIPYNEILKLEEDFAEEIIYNSNIVIRKDKWFNYALKIEFVILPMLIIIFILK